MHTDHVFVRLGFFFFPLQQIEALAQFERVMVNLLGLKDVILLIVD
jgi:hypothetical protein